MNNYTQIFSKPLKWPWYRIGLAAMLGLYFYAQYNSIALFKSEPSQIKNNEKNQINHK